MKHLFNAFVGLTLIIGLLTSCVGKPNPYAKSKEDYEQAVKCFAADESLSPVMEEQKNAFVNKTHRELYSLYMDEQDAIDKLLNIDVYMAITTRRLTPEEEQSIKNKQHTPRVYPLAYDGFALIVNKDNPDSVMSVTNFQKILSGEVTRWKDIYPTTTLDDSIHVTFDSPRSSSVRYCQDSILLGRPMKTDGNVRAQVNSTMVVDYVEKHKNAIGIVGSNWLDDHRDTTSLAYSRNIKVMYVGPQRLNSLSPMKLYEFYKDILMCHGYCVATKPLQWYIAYNQYPFTRSIYAICTDPRGNGDQRRFADFLWNPGEQGQLIFHKAGFFAARGDYEERNVVVR